MYHKEDSKIIKTWKLNFLSNILFVAILKKQNEKFWQKEAAKIMEFKERIINMPLTWE